jgi:histidinol-phosphate aminotransferase
MARYSLQQKFGDALHMDFLENSIGPSAAANDALRGSAGAAMARYPDPRLGALRAKLSDRTGIPADCFTFGNGSTEIVDRVLRTFVRPGETVVASDPTWPVFERMCRLHGIGIISVPYHLDLASGCARLDLNDILRAIDTRTRLIYLVSPNNPLGASVPEEEFRQFLTRLRPHLPVVVDGAYAEYCSRPDALQARRVLSETDKPLIGIHTFSKFFGLAGLRIGYAYAHQSVLALISRLHLPFSVSGPAEAAAVGALCDEVHAQQTLTAVREGRRQVRDALKGMGLCFLASDANFVMAELPAPAEVVYQTLTDEHIYLPEVVWNGLMQLPIGTEDENRRYLDILARLKRSQHG